MLTTCTGDLVPKGLHSAVKINGMVPVAREHDRGLNDQLMGDSYTLRLWEALNTYQDRCTNVGATSFEPPLNYIANSVSKWSSMTDAVT